jgi:hypothetical protein
VGIAAAALNKFMGHAFLEEMERTTKINETPSYQKRLQMM